MQNIKLLKFHYKEKSKTNLSEDPDNFTMKFSSGLSRTAGNYDPFKN